eukprot:scaffold45516_cov60-Phaeocystis_antarctica.AAC.1
MEIMSRTVRALAPANAAAWPLVKPYTCTIAMACSAMFDLALVAARSVSERRWAAASRAPRLSARSILSSPSSALMLGSPCEMTASTRRRHCALTAARCSELRPRSCWLGLTLRVRSASPPPLCSMNSCRTGPVAIEHEPEIAVIDDKDVGEGRVGRCHHAVEESVVVVRLDVQLDEVVGPWHAQVVVELANVAVEHGAEHRGSRLAPREEGPVRDHDDPLLLGVRSAPSQVACLGDRRGQGVADDAEGQLVADDVACEAAPLRLQVELVGDEGGAAPPVPGAPPDELVERCRVQTAAGCSHPRVAVSCRDLARFRGEVEVKGVAVGCRVLDDEAERVRRHVLEPSCSVLVLLVESVVLSFHQISFFFFHHSP